MVCFLGEEAFSSPSIFRQLDCGGQHLAVHQFLDGLFFFDRRRHLAAHQFLNGSVWVGRQHLAVHKFLDEWGGGGVAQY